MDVVGLTLWGFMLETLFYGELACLPSRVVYSCHCYDGRYLYTRVWHEHVCAVVARRRENQAFRWSNESPHGQLGADCVLPDHSGMSSRNSSQNSFLLMDSPALGVKRHTNSSCSFPSTWYTWSSYRLPGQLQQRHLGSICYNPCARSDMYGHAPGTFSIV